MAAMKHRMVLALVGIIVGCCVWTLWPVPAMADVGVGPDPASTQYIVRGGVILDDSFTGPPDSRQQAVWCQLCEWTTTLPCDSSGTICGLHGLECPRGYFVRVWFRETPQKAWRYLGLVCNQTQTLTKVTDIQQRVSIRYVPLPPLLPASQPSARALTGLPVWFRTGQSTRLQRTVTVLGWQVTVTAVPTWTWTWGDGASLATHNAGGTYPLGGVRHSYASRGRHTVRLVARWSADWQISDLPSQPVSGTLSQSRTLTLDVRPARADLVPTIGTAAG